ncbi:hypothetical protein M0Q97_03390 [Candidatus Dojkabacteria bacterium]|jgi:hypothetical protein|nr:hypothetical protein [Candidatus Dojkabacteria bacterium]
MKFTTKLNEYLNQRENDLMIEMARINDKKQFPYDVFVYGGNSYGGRIEHGEPHFHFSDNIKNPKKFKLTILIPTNKEWNSIKDLIIISEDSSQNSWNGLKKEKERLIIWLDQYNKDFELFTNIETIKRFWNSLNSDNNNVKQIID